MKDSSSTQILCLFSKRLLPPKREKIRFMHRQEPMNEQDSGWQFYSGFEPEVIGPEDLVLCPLDRVCELDPSVKALLGAPVGAAWERLPETEVWERVEDLQVESGD